MNQAKKTTGHGLMKNSFIFSSPQTAANHRERHEEKHCEETTQSEDLVLLADCKWCKSFETTNSKKWHGMTLQQIVAFIRVISSFEKI